MFFGACLPRAAVPPPVPQGEHDFLMIDKNGEEEQPASVGASSSSRLAPPMALDGMGREAAIPFIKDFVEKFTGEAERAAPYVPHPALQLPPTTLLRHFVQCLGMGNLLPRNRPLPRIE